MKKYKNSKKGLKAGTRNQFLTKNAQRMRINPTEMEDMFRRIMREMKIPFKQQVPFQIKNKKEIYKYIFDFVVADKWVVEIDGGYHNNIEQKIYDNERDKITKKYGFKVKRFTNEEILDYSDKFARWLNTVIKYVAIDCK